ncbi:DEDD exonuclease domain-containing protein [Arcanobacterium phocae]|uniref:DEDD exonuclease domain-containing protein n=2 Tax=Arcanobacterium phocae TaxID=131112 RepID=UPI001C0EA797|nr:DEDD exonuclease domain-containing protein [Arcanobacterium phocae]
MLRTNEILTTTEHGYSAPENMVEARPKVHTMKIMPVTGQRIDTDRGVIHRRGEKLSTCEQLSFDDLGLPLSEVTFLVVDVETTGEKPGLHALTEIGAVKVRGGEVVGEFSSLINPQVPIPAFISRLTGITNATVATAPNLDVVLPLFIDFIGSDTDLVFVAHNAAFDMGQLRGAAEALELSFPKRKVVDTVKLSRRVFTRDEVPNHKLSSLARFVQATTSPSHRALDDARATVDVFHAILARLGSLGVTHLDDLLVAHSRVPGKRRLKAHLADQIPALPGVYKFIGPNNEILYIGTSKNLYKRVRSYFTAAEKRRRIGEMVDLAVRVDTIVTKTVIEAQILEIRLIRDLEPPYNRRSKPRARYWLKLTDEKHPRLTASRVATFDNLDVSLGPFTKMGNAKAALELVNSCTNLRTCAQVLPSQPDGRPACHQAELKLCDAPCQTGIEQKMSYEKVERILRGDVDDIYLHSLKRMKELSANERFEYAQRERDRIYALVGGARAQALMKPLIQSGRIIAATPHDQQPDAWEIVITDYGQLVDSNIVCGANEVHTYADSYNSQHPLSEPPEQPFTEVTTNELHCLSSWLWRDLVRIVYVSQPEKLATRVSSSQKIMLPDIAGVDQAIWEA